MDTLERSTSAVVLSAGSSTRMGMETNKILLDLHGRTVLEHSLEVFSAMPEIAEIVLVVSAADRDRISHLEKRLDALGVRKIVTGGARRFDSAVEGAAACNSESRLILIHDGARPFPPIEAVRKALGIADAEGGAILAIPLQDTLKRGDDMGRIVSTLPRKDLYRAQTPQVFQQSLLQAAIVAAREKDIDPTDDALLLEAIGHNVTLVPGDPLNIKITTQEDLLLARALLQVMENRGESR